MSRKSDIRKASREAVKRAKAQQAVRVDEFQRSMGCAEAMNASRAWQAKQAALTAGNSARAPISAPCPNLGENVVKLRPQPSNLLGNI